MNGSPQHETIVVGVDGSAASAAAVRWAAAEAVRRPARLHAVHVVEHDRREDTALGHDTRRELDRARRTVPGHVGGWLYTDGFDVEVAVTVVTGDVAGQLAREARDATLVVIGAPDALQPSSLPVDLAVMCWCPVALVGELGDLTFVDSPRNPHTEGALHART